MPQNHFLAKFGHVPVEGGAIGYTLYKPFDDEAAKKTPLIIVHGGPGNSHAGMYTFLGDLANDRPVVFYDQLGSFYSPGNLTPDLMRVDRFADELTHLSAALGFDKFLLFGQSWGSAVSAAYTMDHNDRVAGLVLSGPHLSTPRWIADCNRLLADFPQDIQDTMRRCEADGTTDSEEYKAADQYFWKKHVLRRDPAPPSRELHTRTHNMEIYMTMWGPSEFTCHGLLGDMDLTPRLPDIKVPTLFICGEYDTATPPTVKDFSALVPGSRVEVIKDSGHVSYGDNNEIYLKTLRDFFAELGV